MSCKENQCCAVTDENKRCPNTSLHGTSHCKVHYSTAIKLYKTYKRVCETAYNLNINNSSNSSDNYINMDIQENKNKNKNKNKTINIQKKIKQYNKHRNELEEDLNEFFDKYISENEIILERRWKIIELIINLVISM